MDTYHRCLTKWNTQIGDTTERRSIKLFSFYIFGESFVDNHATDERSLLIDSRVLHG